MSFKPEILIHLMLPRSLVVALTRSSEALNQAAWAVPVGMETQPVMNKATRDNLALEPWSIATTLSCGTVRTNRKCNGDTTGGTKLSPDQVDGYSDLNGAAPDGVKLSNSLRDGLSVGADQC